MWWCLLSVYVFVMLFTGSAVYAIMVTDYRSPGLRLRALGYGVVYGLLWPLCLIYSIWVLIVGYFDVD